MGLFPQFLRRKQVNTFQQTNFDKGFKQCFIEQLSRFTNPKLVGSFRQLMLTEATRSFFEKLNAYWITREIASFLPDLAKTGEAVFVVRLSFNAKGYVILTVVDEDLERVIIQSDSPIKERDFKFYLYRDQIGFTLRLYSEI